VTGHGAQTGQDDQTRNSASSAVARGTRPGRIGFAGLGNMGQPMARRLLNAGWDLTVYNRTPGKAASLVAAGARKADSLQALRHCDIVITMIGTDDDLRAVTIGPGGLLGIDGPAPLLIDCSTVSAQVTTEVAAVAKAQGSDLLAAPVAGGPSVIGTGGLAIVCSGARQAYDYALPVLETLAGKIIYAGEGATSRTVKILHNLVAAVLVHSLAEVCVLAESLGIRRQDLLEFICAGAVGSPFIGYKSALMNSLDFAAAFTAALMLKDADLGLDLARSTGVQTPLIDGTRAAIADLIAAGRGELDIAALLVHLAETNGIVLE
jgi:3-hydroxyisobutyrate dehydrogenase-like beta-hydroxyacid dehydrogenase